MQQTMAGSFICIQFVAFLIGDINQIMLLFLGVWILDPKSQQIWLVLTCKNLDNFISNVGVNFVSWMIWLMEKL